MRIPEEMFRDPGIRQLLTMRTVLAAVGVDPRWLAIWSLYGTPYDGQLGCNPALDFPVPEPGAAADPTIGIYLNSGAIEAATPVSAPAVLTVSAPAVAAPAGSSNADSSEVFSRMDTAWTASMFVEQQVAGMAKQIAAALQRVNSLNRDLSPEESRFGDQQDKREWQEARRWMRDIAVRLSRVLKDHLVGMTSAAGKRTAYETLYNKFVVPRQPFEGLDQAEREFELYRKTTQTLLNAMTAAHASAMQDGERRAQQILARISAKCRAARAKR